MMNNKENIDVIDILDGVFSASCKLKLMQTVLGVLIKIIEDEDDIKETAIHLATNQGVIDDFLHITLDGVCFAIQTLDELQEGGVVNE